VTSPSAECSYNHSTLLCRPSIVFWVFLGDVNHLSRPKYMQVSKLVISMPKANWATSNYDLGLRDSALRRICLDA